MSRSSSDLSARQTLRLPAPSPTKRASSVEPRDFWYPYYAAFPTNWVMETIRSLPEKCRQGIILDPWNGSGSTTLGASLSGIPSYGIDLNPVASVVALSKLVRKNDVTWLRENGSKIAHKMARLVASKDNSNISIFRASDASIFVQARRLVDKTLVQSARDYMSIQVGNRKLTPCSALILVCAWQSLRNCLPSLRSANPSWTRVEAQEIINPAEWAANFSAVFSRCVDSLEDATEPLGPVTLLTGDARSISLPNESVSAVVGSPPYLTRIDYYAMTRLESEWLESSPEVIRNQLTGTTQIRPGTRDSLQDTIQNFPPGVSQLLRAISSHASTGSFRYYAPNVAQYFVDVRASLKQISRLLEVGGHAKLVLQSSFYKEIKIDLASLFAELAKEVSLETFGTANHPADCYFDRVRSSRWRDRSYEESVLTLIKSGLCLACNKALRLCLSSW